MPYFTVFTRIRRAGQANGSVRRLKLLRRSRQHPSRRLSHVHPYSLIHGRFHPCFR